jgi:hypothetical protein
MILRRIHKEQVECGSCRRAVWLDVNIGDPFRNGNIDGVVLLDGEFATGQSFVRNVVSSRSSVGNGLLWYSSWWQIVHVFAMMLVVVVVVVVCWIYV